MIRLRASLHRIDNRSATFQMSERIADVRQDSMADKETNVDGTIKSVTEDTESASHEDTSPNDLEPKDLEKANGRAAAREPLRRTITAQDWNGPDDPENPLNWYDAVEECR